MRRFFVLIFLVSFGLSVFANEPEYPVITAENVMNLREVEVLGSDNRELGRYRILSMTSGRLLYYAPDDSILLLELDSLQEIAVLPIGQSELLGEAIYAEADGTMLMMHRDRHFAFRVDSVSGATIARFDSPNQHLYYSYFSPDFRYLVSRPDPNELDARAQIWNANTGERLQVPENYWLLYPYFYDDARVMAWTGETLIIFEPDTGRISYELATEEPSDLRFSPNREYIAIVAYPTSFYRLATGEKLLENYLDIGDFAFSTDSQYLAFLAEDSVSIMSLNDGNIVHSIEFPSATSVGFLRDGRLYVISHNEYSNEETEAIYELGTWELSDAPRPIPDYRPSIETDSLRFFNDGHVLEIEDHQGRLLASFNIDEDILGFALSSDGTRLFLNYGYQVGRVGIWAVGE